MARNGFPAASGLIDGGVKLCNFAQTPHATLSSFPKAGRFLAPRHDVRQPRDPGLETSCSAGVSFYGGPGRRVLLRLATRARCVESRAGKSGAQCGGWNDQARSALRVEVLI